MTFDDLKEQRKYKDIKLNFNKEEIEQINSILNKHYFYLEEHYYLDISEIDKCENLKSRHEFDIYYNDNTAFYCPKCQINLKFVERQGKLILVQGEELFYIINLETKKVINPYNQYNITLYCELAEYGIFDGRYLEYHDSDTYYDNATYLIECPECGELDYDFKRINIEEILKEHLDIHFLWSSEFDLENFI